MELLAGIHQELWDLVLTKKTLTATYHVHDEPQVRACLP